MSEKITAFGVVDDLAGSSSKERQVMDSLSIIA